MLWNVVFIPGVIPSTLNGVFAVVFMLDMMFELGPLPLILILSFRVMLKLASGAVCVLYAEDPVVAPSFCHFLMPRCLTLDGDAGVASGLFIIEFYFETLVGEGGASVLVLSSGLVSAVSLLAFEAVFDLLVILLWTFPKDSPVSLPEASRPLVLK